MKRNATRRLLTALLAAAMCLSMAACGSKPAADNGSADTDASAGDNAARKYTIGVCQLVTHDALDAATQGFIDAVKDKLGEENVTIDVQNAANDQNVCTTIVNTFVSKKVDLIMANATPALQAAYNATAEIPILGTSVTEYGVALGIDNFSGTVGGNVSGTSDLAPLTEQADMILELLPATKTVGLLYCSAEPNSEYQVQVVEEYLRPAYEDALRPADPEIEQLVRAADKLSAHIKCIEELKAGNTEFRQAAAQTAAAMDAMALPELDYFREHFLPSYSLTLDELE